MNETQVLLTRPATPGDRTATLDRRPSGVDARGIHSRGTPGPGFDLDPPGVHLRPAGTDDHQALDDLLAAISLNAYLWRFLAGRGGRAPAWIVGRLLDRTGGRRGSWLATSPDGAVGHVCWTLCPDPTGLVADLGVVVLDSWQRRGIGGALLDAAAREAAAAGATGVRVEVHPSNHPVVTTLRRRLARHQPRLQDGLVTWTIPIQEVIDRA